MKIGIIGTGDMGKLYAREFAKAGYSVNCCELLEKKEEIEKWLENLEMSLKKCLRSTFS